jgi:hypothetical protein
MSKFIVVTSIFEPTEAIKNLSQKEGYQLIVVGDEKTPANWQCDSAIYLSIERQETLDFRLIQYLPYNHYCRKMIGYLYAMSNKADIIIDTDDDNIPLSNWGFPSFDGGYRTIAQDMGFINIYELYTDQKIWPRGYPLRLINKAKTIPSDKIYCKQVKVGIWQGLANEDPDVDAIYRLTSDQECIFKDSGSFAIDKGTISPFNSQNTAFSKDLFVLLYLPAFVTFRFTDILRSLVAQPILWLYGFNLGFTNATVRQKRNPHDYMMDFESEMPMYLHAEKIVERVSSSISASQSIDENLYSAYRKLTKEGIVPAQEMQCLEAWLSDCKKYAKAA